MQIAFVIFIVPPAVLTTPKALAPFPADIFPFIVNVPDEDIDTHTPPETAADAMFPTIDADAVPVMLIKELVATQVHVAVSVTPLFNVNDPPGVAPYVVPFVTFATVALTSTVTVKLLDDTLSPETGTTPPVHVEVADQLPA